MASIQWLTLSHPDRKLIPHEIVMISTMIIVLEKWLVLKIRNGKITLSNNCVILFYLLMWENNFNATIASFYLNPFFLYKFSYPGAS